jgi:hypothetical protein
VTDTCSQNGVERYVVFQLKLAPPAPRANALINEQCAWCQHHKANGLKPENLDGEAARLKTHPFARKS